jgi:oligoribonuclease NrnB/cAMP/cGMP phosphodiesterase (DHH superfamily)
VTKLCIYHGNCADGFGAAWAVRHALGNGVEFYPGVYQHEPPDVKDREVVMVDFSYKRPVLEKMINEAKSVTVIDHHKTAKDDLLPLMMTGVLAGQFDTEKSGAMLAWEWFNPGKEPPALIRHIQDRDLWKFELEGTREIQAAVFSYPYDFQVWDKLMAMEPQELRKDGAAIERKHFKDIREFIQVAAWRMDLAGYNIPTLNAPYFWSSDAGHIMAENEPFAACYWDSPDGLVFSLRSTDKGVDVSEIAKQYGGGGHRNASGFKVPRGTFF